MEARIMAGFVILTLGLIFILFYLYWQDHKEHTKLKNDHLILRAKYKLLFYGASMFRASRYCKLCSPGGCVVCDQFRELIDTTEEVN